MSVAALFDLDGTLLRIDVDIEEVRQRLAALFAPYGVSRPFRPILKRIPEAAAEAVGAGGAPLTDDDRGRLARAGFAVLDEWEVAGARSARPRPEAAEVLAALAARGVRLGLVTNNGRACVPVALAAARLPAEVFAAISTRDDAAPKPDPAGIIAVARKTGAKTVWYVGDHPRDVQAARAAAAVVPGLRAAAIRGGLASDEELGRAGADAVLADLRGVLGLPGIAE